MQQIVDNAAREIGTAFLKIELADNSYLVKVKEKLKVVSAIIKNLEDTIESKPFKTQSIEIDYYKVQKPRLSKYIILFQNIIRIEQNFPIGTKKQLKAYLTKELISLSNFYKKNRTLYQYSRGNNTHEDHLHFTRSNLNKEMMAAIYASEMLQEYLIAKRKIIGTITSPTEVPVHQQPSKLKWTETQAGLIELIYALHAKGCINDGKATIKSIVETFELAFNIQLPDYRRTFQDIKNRHDSARFLNKLGNALSQKVDSSFE